MSSSLMGGTVQTETALAIRESSLVGERVEAVEVFLLKKNMFTDTV